MSHRILHILKGDCPNCHKGSIFQKSKRFLRISAPHMHSHCANCGHRFEKEPGYFMGAMYVSYGLCVAEMFIPFIIAQLLGVDATVSIYFVILPVLLLWRFNFRMSRILWIYLI